VLALTRGLRLQICLGPVCVPVSAFVPALIALAHQRGWLKCVRGPVPCLRFFVVTNSSLACVQQVGEPAVVRLQVVHATVAEAESCSLSGRCRTSRKSGITSRLGHLP
jgi:hypothetical protein